MSSYYEDVYQKRLNRYGLDYQSRIQSQREREFDNYLYKTIYRVNFFFDGEEVPASLERYKQDDSQSQGYLLTKVDVKIPNGTILTIQNQDDTTTPWMVWWLEQIQASGYNRYIVLKMTHCLSWKTENEKVEQLAYFSGPGTAAIADAVRSSTVRPIYSENNNLHTFITTQNDAIVRDMYFEVKQGNITQGYVVTGIDINSTPGVAYVSVDPVPLREESPKPQKSDTDKQEDFFWLQGGIQ